MPKQRTLLQYARNRVPKGGWYLKLGFRLSSLMFCTTSFLWQVFFFFFLTILASSSLCVKGGHVYSDFAQKMVGQFSSKGFVKVNYKTYQIVKENLVVHNQPSLAWNCELYT